MRAVHDAARQYLASLYPDPNYNDPNNLYNYVYHSLEPQNREEMKMRFDWNISNSTKAFVRISRDPASVESPRGTWWAPSDVALPTPNVDKELGRSYNTQRRVGAEPVDDQRGGRQLHAG